MADNTTLDAGSGGDTIASDDISGVKFQRVKLVIGADGTNDGDVASGNPLPIDDAGGSLTVDGTVTANLSTTDNTVLDNIQTAVEVIDNAISGSEMQVDVVASLPAGTNAIGKLAANSGVDIGDVDVASHPSDTFVAEAGALGKGVLLQGDDGTDRKNVNVDATTGDVQVDVTNTVTVAAHAVTNAGTFATQVDGDALTALQLIDDAVHVDDAAFTLGTSKGVMAMGFAGTQSVDANDAAALACDTDGALHISDGGNSITVDGSVTANAGTNLNTSALALETGGNLATLAGAVSGTEVQVDVVAALPAGTNAIGKLAANSGVDIGDVDILSVTPGTAAGNLGKAEDAAHSSGDTGVMALGVRDTDPAAVSGTDGDYEPLHVNDDGGAWVTATPSHTGGYTGFTSVDLDESEEQVSATACTVGSMYFWNATAAPLWAQIFNATAASIAPGSDAPDINFLIPANADSDGAGVSIPIPNGGLGFSTALSVAVTTGSGTNSGAPGTGDAGCFITYKN